MVTVEKVEAMVVEVKLPKTPWYEYLRRDDKKDKKLKRRELLKYLIHVTENEQMDTKTLISNFIDSVINDDNDAIKSNFSQLAASKMKQGYAHGSATKLTNSIVESFNLLSKTLHEDLNTEQPIKMSQSGIVFVKGKKVGVVKSTEDRKDASGVSVFKDEDFDRNRMDGIEFISLDGSFSKEFETLEQLYHFLADRFGVN